MTRLTSCPDAQTVARRAAAHIARELQRALQARGEAHLALSGGSTPGGAYGLLAGELGDWSGVELWFADERCVPPEDERSNYRLVAETLLAPAHIPAQSVHRMRGELGPEEGAREYARELTRRLAPSAPAAGEPPTPVLDLVVLGIGPDGHIASLFPGSPALAPGEQASCLGVRAAPKPPPERITLGLGVLRQARGCLLLALGAGKADAVAAMLGEPTPSVPASLLRRERLTVIVDDGAAPAAPRT